MLIQPRHQPQPSVLSHLEASCLQKLADGCTEPQIAETLGLSQQTTGMVLRSCCEKLNANTRYHALVKAIRLGLIKI